MRKDSKSYRILVVEDNDGDLTIVEDFLMERIMAPVIVHAANFRQASSILSAPDAEFDAILLDLSLPDKSGQDLIAAMLRICPLCPIIILTGFTDIEFSIKSIAQGIFDYLLKDDLNAAMLFKSILYAIERRKTIDELRESKKRYSDLFHLSPQPMWVFDPETFRFSQVNRAAVELYGYEESEFLDMTIWDIELPEYVHRAREIFGEENAVNRVYHRTAMHRKKSTEMLEVEIYSTPIVSDNKSLRSVIAIDVTEKNRHEQNIVKAIIKTQEDERYEIGGELHDNVCQTLAVIQLNLGMLEEDLPSTKMPVYHQVNNHIKTVIAEIRNISHRLVPTFSEDITLEESFRTLVDNFNVEEKLEFRLSFTDIARERSVPLEIQRNVYRILQEALKNILKYAGATRIEIEVTVENNQLRMRVADNGRGFDMPTVKKGIGLANIKRRVEMFHGTFQVNASEGNGCEIITSIPLPG